MSKQYTMLSDGKLQVITTIIAGDDVSVTQHEYTQDWLINQKNDIAKQRDEFVMHRTREINEVDEMLAQFDPIEPELKSEEDLCQK